MYGILADLLYVSCIKYHEVPQKGECNDYTE